MIHNYTLGAGFVVENWPTY